MLSNPRTSLSAPQTQALVSLLATVGPYVSADVFETSSGAVVVTVWRQGEPTRWRLESDGQTREIPARVDVPA